jgi:hypothetical protein
MSTSHAACCGSGKKDEGTAAWSCPTVFEKSSTTFCNPSAAKKDRCSFPNAKNKKQRALFVVDRLFQELTRYLAHPQSPKNKRAALFPAQPDTAISNNRLQNIVKQHAQKAGITCRKNRQVFTVRVNALVG